MCFCVKETAKILAADTKDSTMQSKTLEGNNSDWDAIADSLQSEKSNYELLFEEKASKGEIVLDHNKESQNEEQRKTGNKETDVFKRSVVKNGPEIVKSFSEAEADKKIIPKLTGKTQKWNLKAQIKPDVASMLPSLQKETSSNKINQLQIESDSKISTQKKKSFDEIVEEPIVTSKATPVGFSNSVKRKSNDSLDYQSESSVNRSQRAFKKPAFKVPRFTKPSKSQPIEDSSALKAIDSQFDKNAQSLPIVFKSANATNDVQSQGSNKSSCTEVKKTEMKNPIKETLTSFSTASDAVFKERKDSSFINTNGAGHKSDAIAHTETEVQNVKRDEPLPHLEIKTTEELVSSLDDLLSQSQEILARVSSSQSQGSKCELSVHESAPKCKFYSLLLIVLFSRKRPCNFQAQGVSKWA